MTGIFDFVRDIVPFAKVHGFVELVETVLKKTISENKSKNFTNWLIARKKALADHPYYNWDFMKKYRREMEGPPEEYDIDELATFFDRFHDLDHRHHHKVFCRKSHNILYQFRRLFGYFPTTRNNYICAREFVTLKKYVPSIMNYMNEYYTVSPVSHGLYILKEE